MSKKIILGRGGSLVVSLHAFFSDDSSSNSAKVFSFYSVKLLEKNEYKKEATVGPF